MLWSYFIKKYEEVISRPIFSIMGIFILGFILTIPIALFDVFIGIVIDVLIVITVIVITILLTYFASKKLDYFDAARYEFNRSKFNNALKCLDQVLVDELDAENLSKLFFLKARIYEKLKLVDESIVFYEKSIEEKMYAFQWEAYYAIARIYRGKYGVYSLEALNAYLKTRNFRVKLNIETNELDIQICSIIKEIYEHNDMKDESSIWFLKEMAVRESLLDINAIELSRKLIVEAEIKSENNQNIEAIAIYNHVIELLEPKLSRYHIRIAELYLSLGNIYCYKINNRKHLDIAISHFMKVIEIRKKYLGDSKDQTKLCLKRSLESLIDALEEYTREGDENYVMATKCFEEGDITDTKTYKKTSINAYKNAIDLAKEIYGKNSLQIANLNRKLSLCYKWFVFSLEDLANAKECLLITYKIWNEIADVKKNNVTMSLMLLDLGGVFYMEMNDEECLKWRLEAYKVLKNGAHTLEQLGEVELSIMISFKNSKTNIKYEDFLKEHNIVPLIENYNVIELGPRRYQYTVKIKNVEKPFVWIMG